MNVLSATAYYMLLCTASFLDFLATEIPCKQLTFSDDAKEASHRWRSCELLGCVVTYPTWLEFDKRGLLPPDVPRPKRVEPLTHDYLLHAMEMRSADYSLILTIQFWDRLTASAKERHHWNTPEEFLSWRFGEPIRIVDFPNYRIFIQIEDNDDKITIRAFYYSREIEVGYIDDKHYCLRAYRVIAVCEKERLSEHLFTIIKIIEGFQPNVYKDDSI